MPIKSDEQLDLMTVDFTVIKNEHLKNFLRKTCVISTNSFMKLLAFKWSLNIEIEQTNIMLEFIWRNLVNIHTFEDGLSDPELNTHTKLTQFRLIIHTGWGG